MRRTILALGLITLGVAWLGPFPSPARASFAAHMTRHMAVVAVAAPLLALALAGTSYDPVRAWRAFPAPIPASVIEFAVVWGWHAPAFHHAARYQLWALVLEQASFLTAGLLLWVAVLGGEGSHRAFRRGSGIVALLFTSMHMTLLGALFALANRPLFTHAAETWPIGSALADQHLGGTIMLLAGGASYLLGGLCLTGDVLRKSIVRREASS